MSEKIGLLLVFNVTKFVPNKLMKWTRIATKSWFSSENVIAEFVKSMSYADIIV